MLETLPSGGTIVGSATVQADDPPTEVNITVSDDFRCVFLVFDNDDRDENLVFVATENETGPTAVELPPNNNGTSVPYGPIAFEALPVYLYCTVPTDVQVSMVGYREGDLEQFVAR